MSQLSKDKKSMRQELQLLISIIVLLIGAIVLIGIMRAKAYYASGCDIWGHLFKSDIMFRNLKQGNPYPLYTNLWYNGIQPYRYWAPLPYYVLAGLQYITRGDVMESYYLFAGFSFFFGGLGWVFFGYSTKRIPFCTFLGCLWFFLPENFRVYYCEGNLPRMMTAILIPYLVWFIWKYVRCQRNLAMIGITIFMALISLCHVMISAMMGIAAFVFLSLYAIFNRQWKRPVQVIFGLLLAYLVVGIWLIPALSGGLVGMSTESTRTVMEALTYRLSVSLDPFNRLHGIIDTFYYGLAITVISLVGIICAPKKIKAGFITVILILLCTTPESVVFLSKLPLSQLFWMMRFSTIAYALFGCALIEWKEPKRYVKLILMLLLFLDCIPSFSIERYYIQTEGRTNDEIEIAKEITNQRVTLLDLSTYGSYPSYGICEGEDAVPYSYGWAWQGAATSANIVMLNTSLETENYRYLFDRCLELGNDTVLLRKLEVGKCGGTREEVIQAANEVGYYLYQDTNDMYIFHMDTPPCFGVKTEYTGLAIGMDASYVSLAYPKFQLGISNFLDEYTLEELKEYEVVYLAGFDYHDRLKAEQLVNDLASSGVRVIIDMSHIPVDAKSRRKIFLGILDQDVSFESYFPTLEYKGNSYVTDYFPEDNTVWNTSYMENVPVKLGTTDYSGQRLTFAGTSEDGNIIFLGLNLLYYAVESDDQTVYPILNDIFGMVSGELPKRTIVPMNVTYKPNQIIIDSEEKDVNTTIAYQDNFESIDGISNSNHLLNVEQKHTVISLVYPKKQMGFILSILGVLLFITYIPMLYIINGDDRKETQCEEQKAGEENAFK